MKRNHPAQSFIDFINTFSIWVVLGSFLTYCFFALSFNQIPNIAVGVILAISIWIIYTLDHWLDGYKTKGNSLSLRHNLHFKYRKPLLFLMICFLFILIYLVLSKLEEHYLRFGFILFTLTALHFGINHFASKQLKTKYYIKEVFIAFVVSLGFCGLPVCHLSSNEWTNSIWILFGAFFLLNLGNLLLFSYFDFQEDLESEFVSSANTFGPIKALVWAKYCCLSSIAVLLVAILILNVSVYIGGTLLLMNAVLLLLCLYPSYFKPNGNYRFWGDFIYLLPVVALPFL